jgi:hypothetical protein
MSKNSKKEIVKIRENYLSELRDAQDESIKQFDTQILYISSGALLLSLTFLGDVIKLEKAIYKWTLIVSWILLGLTIILSVLSHLTSYYQHEKAIKKIEDGDEPIHDSLNRIVNQIIASIFLAGICFLVVFAVININNI